VSREATDQAYLSIDRCRTHGYWAVSVRRGTHGERMTPSKCCGTWESVQEWPISATALRNAADWFDSPDWPIALENGARPPHVTDTKRLDWLEAKTMDLDEVHIENYGDKAVLYWPYCQRVNDEGQTIRGAIDAAMQVGRGSAPPVGPTE
jgi:hypothetical protein